jgi:hypothetical protein
MEKCNYCGVEYMPMLRATRPGNLIYVCEYRFTYNEDGSLNEMIPSSECKDKAVADGYTLRRDLTPSR